MRWRSVLPLAHPYGVSGLLQYTEGDDCIVQNVPRVVGVSSSVRLSPSSKATRCQSLLPRYRPWTTPGAQTPSKLTRIRSPCPTSTNAISS